MQSPSKPQQGGDFVPVFPGTKQCCCETKEEKVEVGKRLGMLNVSWKRRDTREDRSATANKAIGVRAAATRQNLGRLSGRSGCWGLGLHGSLPLSHSVGCFRLFPCRSTPCPLPVNLKLS